MWIAISKYLQRKPAAILFIISVLLIFLSFNFNLFHAVNSEKFPTYQSDSEALVIGRLVKSRNDGLLSSEARMGRYMGLDGDYNLNQTKLFIGELEGGNYEEYNSQIGMQGILWSQVDIVFRKIGVEPALRLALYRGMTSLLFALVLSTIIVILYCDIGIEASGFLLFTIAFSKWQVYMGNNLYWMVFMMFSPMLVVFVALKFEEFGKQINILLVSLLVMFFVFLKATMGYEFISTILISTLCPLIYFAVKNSWQKKNLLSRCFLVGFFGLLGFVFAIILHAYQLALATGDVEKAVSVIQERVLTRTYDNPANYKGTPYYESQKASAISLVFNEYLLRGGSFRLKIPYLLWVIVFIFISIKVYKDKYELPELKRSNPVINALIITTWFSILAPLSWFVLAKSHSYIHTDINIILWHLPFMIFGCSLLGYILRARIRTNLSKLVKSNEN